MAAAVADDGLTGQQGAAVSCRQASVVLSSGAGCGKTHVLTRRYLSHLRDDGADVGQVVAITFTDRAARQMRERIRAALAGHLRAAADDAAADRWARHLRDLETAQVSTIHSFCGNLLRQHAVEAGLDPRFEVLEDYLAANLKAQALTACLQRLLPLDGPAGEDLRQLILLFGWKPTVEAVEHLTGQWDDARWSAWLARPAEEVAAEWQGPVRGKLLPRFLHHLTAGHPKVARCLWLLRANPCTGPKMAANVGKILERLPGLALAEDLPAAVHDLKEAAKVAGTEKAKAWASEAVYEAVKTAFEHFRQELPARLAAFLEAPEGVAEAVAVGQRFLRVAAEAVGAYRQLKRRHGVLDFQDLLVLARDLLRDRGDVRKRLQRRFRFLLIDELQDTDPVQMELVDHLCGAGLTGGKLFAVGDHKQSIYRFRGADVSLFQELRRRVPHEGRLGLTVNFRSQPAILDFANALLGPGPAEGTGMEDYEPLQPHHAQVNPGPCVEFLWAPREPHDNVAEARTREADWIARRVAALVNRREELVVDRPGPAAKLRPVRQGDVVLLFRAMSNVELYEAALRAHGLDYYLVGGRAFFAQQEIYDLLNLLRALENPQDGVSLAGTLRAPFCCLSDEALFLLSRHPEGLWAGLHDPATLDRLPAEQRPRAERARRGLGRWRGLKDRLPIARLLGEVFADSGFDAATQFEFLGDRKLANLWKLVDLARTFDRSGMFGLAEFIGRLGELVRAQPREEQAATQPENADVVRLMTIHQAKGLEFPVVIVPDVTAAGGRDRHPVACWDPALGCVVRPPAEDPPPFPGCGWRLWEAAEAVEDWRESLRTLYVACTRAQDYLVLSAALPPDYSPESAWMLQLAKRFNLRDGRCLNTLVAAERRPEVRVTDARTPPPEAPAGASPATPDRIPNEGLPVLALLESPPAQPAVAAKPAHLVVFGGKILRAEDVPPFDAEDGSDRTDWVQLRERLAGTDDSEAGWRDRVLWRVLEAWDFKNREAWRPLLRQALEGQADAPALERMLDGFARSGHFDKLAGAREVRRDVEFLVSYPLEANAGPVRAVVRGVIDLLWEDPEGGWNALAFETGQGPKGGREQRPVLAVWFGALSRGLGDRPRSLNLFFLDGGGACVQDGSRVKSAQVRAAFEKLLSGSGR